MGEKLTCHEDKRKEAKEVDEYAIGMYMEARHVLVELLFLIYMFLNAFDQNEVKARVAGSRKLENGLVVPAAFIVRTTKRAFAMKFEKEILRMKDLCGHMNIEVEALRKILVFS